MGVKNMGSTLIIKREPLSVLCGKNDYEKGYHPSSVLEKLRSVVEDNLLCLSMAVICTKVLISVCSINSLINFRLYLHLPYLF